MTINSTTAKQLCTKAELGLFTESLARNITAFDTKALRSRIARSRKLRDKYHQLANRQDREARGKQKPRRRNPSQSSTATRKKEQIFGESLDRFEQQLEKLKSAKAKPKKKSQPAQKKTSKTVPPKKKIAARKKSAVKKIPAKKKIKTKKAPTANSSQVGIAAEERVKTPTARKIAADAAKKTRIRDSGLTRKQKHRSAENRRHQARRDAR